VTHLINTGQTAKAQSVIIAELTKEFGGSAVAAGTTLPGKLAILNEKWDEAKEKIGGAVIPIVSSLLDKYVMPLADWLGKELPGAIQITTNFLNNQLMPAVNALLQSPFVQTIEGWELAIVNHLFPQLNLHLPDAATKSKGAIDTVKTSLKTQADEASGHYVTQMQKAIDKIDDTTTSLGGTAPTGKGLNPAVLRVNDNLDKMDAKLNATAKATQNAQKPTEFLGGFFDGLGNAIHGAGDAIGQFGDDIQKRLPGALPQIQRFGGYLGSVFGKGGVLHGLQTMWNGFWSILSAPVKIAFDQVHTDFNIGLDLLQGDWKQAGKDAQKGIQQTGQDALDALKGVGQLLIGPFEAIGKGWEQAIVHFPDLLPPDLHKKLDNIIPDLEQTIYNWSHMIQDYINDHMPKFPGIGIPGISIPGQQRASGGPVSGRFIGAERGMELLMTPGIYNAPPGSYVYNNQQTQQLLNGGGAKSGQTYNVTVYGADHHSAMQIARDVQAELRRRDLLLGMYGG
ncbi:MAG TPA: hypothetical protein VGF38_01525, partial [Ktedonobacterales bacterium]|jgi:hypothetical protein